MHFAHSCQTQTHIYYMNRCTIVTKDHDGIDQNSYYNIDDDKMTLVISTACFLNKPQKLSGTSWKLLIDFELLLPVNQALSSVFLSSTFLGLKEMEYVSTQDSLSKLIQDQSSFIKINQLCFLTKSIQYIELWAHVCLKLKLKMNYVCHRKICSQCLIKILSKNEEHTTSSKRETG